jgi:hypothetical protein
MFSQTSPLTAEKIRFVKSERFASKAKRKPYLNQVYRRWQDVSDDIFGSKRVLTGFGQAPGLEQGGFKSEVQHPGFQ